VKIAAGILLLAVGAVSPEVRYFRYQRPLSGPGTSGQACVVIDHGVFPHAAPLLADLRLFRDGVEIPYAIQFASPMKGEEKSIAPLNLGVSGGRTVFDAELPDAHYRDVQLAVTAQDFIATVTVTGSRTLGGGNETRIGSYTIFDLTRQKLGRSTILHLSESDFRYLHFDIAGPLTPQSITGISVEHLPTSPSTYEIVAESSHIAQKGHSSTVEFTLPPQIPVDRVSFTPGVVPALFSRDVSISVAQERAAKSTDESVPSPPVVYSGSILRVHNVQGGHRIDQEDLSIDVPASGIQTAAKWTITIDNGDDAPLTLESVRLEMLERSLCFEAVANEHYTLFYGDSSLMAPRYDYATLFAAQPHPLRATAGPEQLNPVYQPRPDLRPFTEKHPALLWSALVAVVALLGAIALRSATRSHGAATPQP
jgi:hypothetical protein